MSTWSGWQNQLLKAAGIIVTPPNRNLLTSWAKHAATSCNNNPIDLSAPLQGSQDCHALKNLTPKAQRYTSHAQAANAFRLEIHDDFAKPLLDALNSGNPFQVDNVQDVANVFLAWGSDAMHDVYLSLVKGQAGGGSGSKGVGPNTHRAWKDVQRSVNKRLPSAVATSKRLRRQTLRDVNRARRLVR